MATTLLAVLGTVWAWRWATVAAEADATERFERRAATLAQALEQRLADAEHVLIGVAGLIAASEHVDRSEWKQFVDAQRIDLRLPGVVGIGFAPHIPLDALDAHERSVRAEGFPSYAVFPPGARDAYTPAVYLEPFDERNRRVFGLDLSTDPARRAAMHRARDDGTAALSGRVLLPQDDGGDRQASVVLYVPVYTEVAPPATVDGRRAALLGYAFAPIRGDDFVRAVLGVGEDEVAVELFDGVAPAGGTRLTRAVDAADARDAVHVALTPITRAGATWTLRTRSLDALERRLRSGTPTTVLVAGVLVTLAASLLSVLYGMLHVANDRLATRVDERTRAAALSEDRYRLIVENLRGHAIISLDLDGRITSWNAAAQRLLGPEEHEVLGTSIARFHVPDDRDAGRLAFLLGEAARHGSWEGEGWRVREDGAVFFASVVITAVTDAHGVVSGFVNVTRDVTARHLADQRILSQVQHLALLDEVTRAIGDRLDLHSVLQGVVGSLEDLLPVAFGCACLYDGASDALRVAVVGVRSEAYARAMRLTEEQDVQIDDNGLRRCVGGELVYEPDVDEVPLPFPTRLAEAGLRSVVLAPLKLESRVFGVLVAARRDAHAFTSTECEFLRQVSEHVGLAAHQAQLYDAIKVAYHDLKQTRDALMHEDRLRTLGQMASGIAHDVNNALTPMLLYTQTMAETETGLSDRGREALAVIGRAVEDVAQTVGRMRAFYRARDEGPLQTPVRLNGLIRDVVELSRARWHDLAQHQGILITASVELDEDLPEVLGVEAEIRDALTNLVFNAIDAMPDGGVLTVRTARSGAGDVVLEVADTGKGMDEPTRSRCLEPFFTTKGELGTGLGLAMVSGMASRHGATLEIDSAPGEGTTVRLVFSAQPEAAGRAASTPTTAEVRPSRILLVDDDPIMQRALCEVLKLDGHAVTTAGGGQDGIDRFCAALAAATPFDVVITDLGMPYVDGRRVARAIKEASPGTPVVMLTGWGRRLDAEGDIPAHVDVLMAKPPKVEHLRATLAKLLPGGAHDERGEG